MAKVRDIDNFLTPDLRQQAAAMKAARGLPTLGFYEDLMANPGLFERVQALGTFLRFEATLPPRVREAAILAAAVEQRSAFEWETHQHTARQAGLADEEIRALGEGLELPAELEDVRDVVRAVVRGQSVPQALFDRVASRLSVPSAVELVTLAAFYRMMAGLGGAFDSALPGSGEPPWLVRQGACGLPLGHEAG